MRLEASTAPEKSPALWSSFESVIHPAKDAGRDASPLSRQAMASDVRPSLASALAFATNIWSASDMRDLINRNAEAFASAFHYYTLASS